MVTRLSGQIGSTLYVDVQNLGLDDGAAANVIGYVLGNWPDGYPRITAISLYTNPGDNERWKAILRDCVSKQMRRDRTWPFAGVQPRENVPAMQQYSRSRAKNTADIALCLDACRDFLQEKTEFVAVVSNDSDFFVLYSKCQEWQADIAGGLASDSDAAFVLVTHQGQRGGGLLSPNMAAIPPKFRWELPEEAKESPASRIAAEEIARNLVLKAEVGVGLMLEHFQGLMKEDQVLQEHPAAGLESSEFESYFNENIWPLWMEWGVTRGSARIGQDTIALFTVSATSMNSVAGQSTELSAAPAGQTSRDFQDLEISQTSPGEVSPPDSWEDPETRNAIMSLVVECFSKPEYTGRDGRERAFSYFKSNFSNHRIVQDDNGEAWEGLWTREIAPLFRLIRDVILFCHGKDTFTATDVRQFVRENYRTHWLGQVEPVPWNSPIWSQMFLPVLQREGSVRDLNSGGVGARYTIPLPSVSASESEIIFEGMAGRLRGQFWQSPFSIHRNLIVAEQTYGDAGLIKWIGEDSSKFGRWWGTVVLPKMNAEYGLQRAPSGSGYRIWPESDEYAARELIRLMPADVPFDAEHAYGKFKQYAYPQADGSLDEFKQYLEDKIVPHLQKFGVDSDRGGFLGRGERTFTVTSAAKSQVRQAN